MASRLDCHLVCVNACSMVWHPSFPGTGPSSCGFILLISSCASARCIGFCDLVAGYVSGRLAKKHTPTSKLNTGSFQLQPQGFLSCTRRALVVKLKLLRLLLKKRMIRMSRIE